MIERGDCFYVAEIFSSFDHINLLKLAKNMRLKLMETDPSADEHVLQYSEYLLQVKEGRIRQNQESEIKLQSGVKFFLASTDLVASI